MADIAFQPNQIGFATSALGDELRFWEGRNRSRGRRRWVASTASLCVTKPTLNSIAGEG
jgi:hypothetical protein